MQFGAMTLMVGGGAIFSLFGICAIVRARRKRVMMMRPNKCTMSIISQKKNFHYATQRSVIDVNSSRSWKLFKEDLMSFTPDILKISGQLKLER